MAHDNDFALVGKVSSQRALPGWTGSEVGGAFRLILENSPVPVVAANINDGTVLFRTPAFAEMLRQRPEDPPPSVPEFAPRAEERAECLRLIRENGSVEDFRMHILRCDGTTFTGSLSARFVEIEGETTLVSNLIDMTPTLERETELQRSRELLEDAIEALDDGFVLYDSDSRLVMCNSRYREFHGDCADLLVPGAYWPEVTRIRGERGFFVAAVGRQEEWLESELAQRGIAKSEQFLSKDGRWFEYSHRPIRQGGFISVWDEITRRKELEEAMRQSEEHFRSIAEGHPLPVWMVDLETSRILYESPAAASMFGREWPSSEPAYSVDHFVDPADRDRLVEKLRIDGSLHDVELRLRRADGSEFWVSLNDQVIAYDGRDVSISNFIDLTDRRQAEAEAARQRELLHQNEKLSALGELLASVAHELNNPLSVLIGQAVMLQENAPDKASLERAEKINIAADRCARIVKTFLAMARRKSDETSLVDINALIEQALEFTAYSLLSTGVEVVKELSSELPPVYANEDQLIQTFTNLIVNAEQALRGTEGPRRLEVSTRVTDGGETVVIIFADNGPGVPEKDRNRIFEPLFTTKETGVGTGLGLALSHRIVESHGGTLELDRTGAPGARFTIRLSRDAAKTASSGEAAEAAKVPEDGLDILVIDDVEDVASVICDSLEMEGHRVDVELSARDALERLKSNSYDIVLSDMRMPELDGVSLHRILEESQPRLAKRLGFITGDTLTGRVSDFLATHDCPYIEKPFMPADLRDLVQRLLAKQAG